MRDGKQELRLLVYAAAVAFLACAGAGTRRDVVAQPVNASQTPAFVAADYVVGPGESLFRIALCSGVSLDYLALINEIPDPDRLAAGARLRLPEGHDCARETLAAGAARARASHLLTAATARLDAADFEGALSLSESCVQNLAPYELDAQAKALRARCHVVAGSAATGLDHPERAIEEFRRALVLDPKLELDSDTTSPRILELVSQARPGPER